MYVYTSVRPCLPDTVEGRLQVVCADMFAYSKTYQIDWQSAWQCVWEKRVATCVTKRRGGQARWINGVQVRARNRSSACA